MAEGGRRSAPLLFAARNEWLLLLLSLAAIPLPPCDRSSIVAAVWMICLLPSLLAAVPCSVSDSLSAVAPSVLQLPSPFDHLTAPSFDRLEVAT